MSPPLPRINTLFEKTSKPIVEPISKIFITASFILGINRLSIFNIANTYCIVFMYIYTTILNVSFFYLTIDCLPQSTPYIMWSIIILIDGLQYLLIVFLGFLLQKRLQKFYLSLNKFDKEIGTRPTKFGIRECVYNFLQLIITLIISAVFYMLNENLSTCQSIFKIVLIKLLNCFELHYYGHLFSLMILRLRALNDCMKSWFPNKRNGNKTTNSADNGLETDRKSHSDMKKLMDFYDNIIIAYDWLNEAVKWQMLSLLMSTFVITLSMLSFLVEAIIWGNTERRNVLPESISLMVIQLFPLMVPCVFADRVQREVCTIKDFLACKLYENTLDKPSRRTARTLLALIETRNLSFSLFHMFYIDIALPFKFMALTLTYLMIILQFAKVISPKKSTFNNSSLNSSALVPFDLKTNPGSNLTPYRTRYYHKF